MKSSLKISDESDSKSVAILKFLLTSFIGWDGVEWRGIGVELAWNWRGIGVALAWHWHGIGVE